MATAGTVTVDFAAETAKFTAELKKVQGSLKRLESDFSSLAKVGQTAFRLFTGSVFANLARSAFAAADATADAANRAGIAVETFSRLQFAAKMADADMGALTSGIQRFQIVMSKSSDENKKAQQTLAAFGLTVEQLQGLSIEDQLGKVSEAFANIQDPADRTRFAVELFGKSAGPQLAPLLAQGKDGLVAFMQEADRLGVTISEKTAIGVGIADNAIKRVVETTKGAFAELAGMLALQLSPPTDPIEKLTVAIHNLDAERKGLQAWKDQGNSLDGIFSFHSEQELIDINAQLAQMNAQLVALKQQAATGGRDTRMDLLPLPWLDAVQTIDLAPIRAMKIEVDDLKQAYLDLDAAVLKVRQDRAIAVAEVLGDATSISAKEIGAQATADVQRQLEEEARLRQYYRDLELRQQQAANDAMLAARQGVYAAGIELLQAYAGESESAARALVIITKASAVAQAIINTAQGVTAALALGPAGIPLATAIKVMGAAQIALILATGYKQIQNVGAHGGAPIGSPVNPVHTQTAPTPQEQAESADRVVQVIVNGNLFSTRETVDYLIEAIRDEIDTKDVVLFSPVSRQAEDIRGAPG